VFSVGRERNLTAARASEENAVSRADRLVPMGPRLGSAPRLMVLETMEQVLSILFSVGSLSIPLERTRQSVPDTRLWTRPDYKTNRLSTAMTSGAEQRRKNLPYLPPCQNINHLNCYVYTTMKQATLEDHVIRYCLYLTNPSSQIVEVSITIPCQNETDVSLFLPVWTPGSYAVRDHSRHLHGLTATDASGESVSVTRCTKNRWTVGPVAHGPVTVRYKVTCAELTVFTNWVDHRLALINGAATFVGISDATEKPHQLTIVKSSSWANTITGFPASAERSDETFLAAGYCEFIDCPLLLGLFLRKQFYVRDRRHLVTIDADPAQWDMLRVVRDLARIVNVNMLVWGSVPYEEYKFMCVGSGQAQAGLEHKSSSCVTSYRNAMRSREDYLNWLLLLAHEHFHAWNGKRLRPVELGPFDYDRENYTISLWVVEGITSYYALLALIRAQFISVQEFLGSAADDGGNGVPSISSWLSNLQSSAGRHLQSLSDASFEAWLGSPTRSEFESTRVSYYTKGAIVGWLLDVRIRSMTSGGKSLDDVMRIAFSRFSGECGYSQAEFRKVAEELSGGSLQEWFAATVDQPGDLDYNEALEFFGLTFRVRKPAAPGSVKAGWLGFSTRIENGRVVVSSVPHGTPAAAAGLMREDEIVAINGYRVRLPWRNQVTCLEPGVVARVLVSRREYSTEIDVIVGQAPDDSWRLEVRPDASGIQRARLSKWLLIDGTPQVVS
jgi:predicted metalloprotease with PDZ domain